MPKNWVCCEQTRTSHSLASRNITYRTSQLGSRLDFKTEWRLFAKLCGSKVTHSAAWKILEPVVNASYENEITFDVDLFNAVINAVGIGRFTEIKNGTNSVYQIKGTHIGIARQVSRHKQLGFPQDYGISGDSIQDHAIVLVKDGRVQEEMAVAALKINESNCTNFSVNENEVQKVDLNKAHGAFAQALIYVAGDVLNCLARCGVAEEEVEVMVLSAKKKPKKSEVITTKEEPKRKKRRSSDDQKRLHYVRGKVNVPEECGGSFSYSIVDFMLCEEKGSEKCGIAAYIHTLRKGIQRAKKANDNVKPLCGRKLCIAGIEIKGWHLVGSPIPRAKPCSPDKGRGLEESAGKENLKPYRVSQGEIFSTTVKKLIPFADADKVMNMYWMTDVRDLNPDTEVLIKCTSRCVHRYLTSPPELRSSILEVRSDDKSREATSSVLLGAFFQTDSTITIMKELKDHKALSPKELKKKYEHGMHRLWVSFLSLVKKELIPLAKNGVVHADTRPSWDETYNILILIQGEGQFAKFVLNLIDYESLCHVNDIPKDDTHRTFQKRIDRCAGGQYTALRYLWWQIMYIAYVWKGELNVGYGKLLKNNAEKFYSRFRRKPLQEIISGLDCDDKTELRRIESKKCLIDADDISKTLEILGKVFNCVCDIDWEKSIVSILASERANYETVGVEKLRKLLLQSLQIDENHKAARKLFKEAFQNLEESGKLTKYCDGTLDLTLTDESIDKKRKTSTDDDDRQRRKKKRKISTDDDVKKKVEKKKSKKNKRKISNGKKLSGRPIRIDWAD